MAAKRGSKIWMTGAPDCIMEIVGGMIAKTTEMVITVTGMDTKCRVMIMPASI